MSGTGQLATLTLNFSSLNLTFSAQNTGTTSSAQGVSISNTGNSPITFASFVLGGSNPGDYSITSNTCPQSSTPLAAGTGCSLTVTFSPTAAGSRTASITVTDSASGSPQVINLTGTGQTPVKSLSFNPSPLTFTGTVNTGSNAVLGLTVSNIGNTGVTFTGFGISGANAGDFSITSNNCPNSPVALGTGSACSLQITFAPTAGGSRNASINFTDDANGSPQSVSVSGTAVVPTLTLSFNPASLTFAAQNLSTTSAAQSVSISNTGNQAITFTGFALTGSNASDFSITANTCPSSSSSLAPGNGCSVSVTFTPSATGSRTASISVTDNATGSPQSIGLSGTGQNTNKVLSFNQSQLTFASTTTGNTSPAQTVTVSNTGTAAVTFSSFALAGSNSSDFAITSNTCALSPATLAAGSYCSFAVAFSPSATGLRTANVVVTDDAGGSPQSVGLSGTGQSPTTTISFSPTSIAFNTPQNVGSTSTQSIIYVTNTGTGPVQFNSFSLAGANPGDFAITQDTCPQLPNTLAKNADCYLGITFSPTANGTRGATLVVTDNATGTPQSVNITGTGQNAAKTLSFSPASYTFTTAVNIGSTSSSVATIYATANGTQPVTFSSIQITGANAGDFAFTTNSCLQQTTLTVNASCYVQVKFTPTAAGTRTANITYTDDATGSPQNVSLTGTGQTITQTLSFSASPVALGTVNVGSTTAQYLYITNSGTGSVNFSAFAITGANSGDFGISAPNSSCSTTNPLAGGGECYVYLTFTPSATGTRNATLQLTDNATGSPQTVNLTGIGQSSTPLVVSPATLSFAAQNQGSTSAAQTVHLYNTSASAITFTGVQITGANSGDFNIAANTCGSSVASAGNCNIMITFAPSASGSRTASLQISDSAAGSPQTVALAGTGQSAASQTLRLSNTSINFPSQVLNTTNSGGSYYVQLYNNGTGSITLGGFSIGGANGSDFAISPSTTCAASGALNPNGSCYIYVTFSPQAVGNRTGTLQISSSAVGSPQTVALTGTGVSSTDQLRISSTGINFSSQVLGTTSGAQGVSLYDDGNSPLTFSSITLAGANASDFTITSDSCPMNTAFSSSCSVYVTFTPSAVGVRTANIVFTDTSTGSPQSVSLTGIGRNSTDNLDISQNGLSFPATILGSTSAQTYFYIYNVGTSPAALNSFTLTGANAGDFAISENECVVAPQTIPAGGNCYVYLTFTPSAIGLRTATLQIADNSPGSPQIVELSGIGQSQTQILDIDKEGLNFSSTNVGSTAAATYFYIYNTGTQPVTLNGFSITGVNSGDFSLGTTTCPSSPATLAGGSNCYSYVSFTPTAIGPRSASVQITDSAPDSPQFVTLNGIGLPVDKIIDVAPQSLSFAAQNIGTTAPQKYF